MGDFCLFSFALILLHNFWHSCTKYSPVFFTISTTYLAYYVHFPYHLSGLFIVSTKIIFLILVLCVICTVHEFQIKCDYPMVACSKILSCVYISTSCPCGVMIKSKSFVGSMNNCLVVGILQCLINEVVNSYQFLAANSEAIYSSWMKMTWKR